MRGGRVGSLAASPTLVGAVTVLVVVVAVFLSYQANQGLPFVPTYKLSAELPNAATLVPGNEVRIGGIRVGQIKSVDPETVDDAPCPDDPTLQCTTQVAKVNMELNQDLDPLPTNSTVVVRAKSALGLKYLEINRGDSSQGFEPGSTMPLSAAQPEPVEIDQVFNMFDEPTRDAIQTNLLEFGNALAGRGVDLNDGDRRAQAPGPGADAGDEQPRPTRTPGSATSSPRSRRPRPRSRRSPRSRASSSPTSTRPSRPSPGSPARTSRRRSPGRRRSRADSDRHPADDPPVPRQHREALRRAAPRLPRPGARTPRTSGAATVEGIKALGTRPGLQRAARPDRPGAAQPLERRRRPPGHQRPDPVQPDPGAAALLHHPGPVGLQLRDAALPQRRRLPRLRPGRRRLEPAVHRPAAADRPEQRDRPELRAGQRRRRERHHQLPPLQPVPEHGLPGPGPRVRGGERGLSGGAGDRERPGQPGHPHRRPDPPAGLQEEARRRRRRARSDSGRARTQDGGAAAQGLRRAGLPQGQPAAPGSQCADPDRARHRRHLPRLDQVAAVPEPFRAPRGLQERRQHPQGLAGPDRGRQRRQGREHQERLRQRPDRRLQQRLLRRHLHGRLERAADPQRRPGRDPAADLPRGQLLPRRQPGQPERPRPLERRHDPAHPDLHRGPARPDPHLAAGARPREPPEAARGLRHRAHPQADRRGRRDAGPGGAGPDRRRRRSTSPSTTARPPPATRRS